MFYFQLRFGDSVWVPSGAVIMLEYIRQHLGEAMMIFGDFDRLPQMADPAKNTLQTFFKHSTIILQTLDNHSTNTRQSFYKHSTIILHLFFEHSSNILRSFYMDSPNPLQSFYKHSKSFYKDSTNTLQIFLQFIGPGTPQTISKHSPDKLQDTPQTLYKPFPTIQ